MAVRSFFVYQPIQNPQSFSAEPAPLLTQQDLWGVAAKLNSASLLFRVRSDQAFGELLCSTDKLESCIGLVDEVVKWRVAFGSVRLALGVIQHPQLLQVCQNAAQMITSNHPAAIPPAARAAVMADVARLVTEPPKGIKAPHPIEAQMALGIAQLAQCESGSEAAPYVPFVGALCPFEEGAEGYDERMATLEVLIGATLLAEGCARLAERAPGWLFAEMPNISAVAQEERPARAPRREEDEG